MSQVFSFRKTIFMGERYHGSHSRTKLEIKGHFSTSGPQPVSDDGGVPILVADIFRNMPKIQSVTLNGESSGVVYSRLKVDEE